MARHANAVTYGAELESEQGSSRYVLPTAVDDSIKEMQAGTLTEKSLAAHLENEAEGVLQKAPPLYPNANLPLKICVAVAMMIALGFCLSGGWRSFQRITAPWVKAPYTRLSFENPSAKVPANHPFILKVDAQGRVPNQLEFHSSATLTGSITKTGRRSYEIQVSQIEKPAEIWITGGDGESEHLAVTPYDAGEVSAFKIKVDPPLYAKRLARTETKPSFTVLRGSAFVYSVEFTGPVKSASLVPVPDEDPLRERPRLPELVSGSRARETWASSLFEPSKDLDYYLQWTTLEGNLIRSPEPYRILVLPDEAPQVRILSHNAEEIVKEGSEEVSFKVKAFDDVGVVKLRLVFRKIGQEHQTLSLKVDAHSPHEFSTDALLALAPLKLEPMDVVAVHAEASDGNHLDGPGVGHSKVVYIEVPAPPPLEEFFAETPPGGGGNIQVINPLEMEKEILKETISLRRRATEKEFDAIRVDQGQTREFTAQLLEFLEVRSVPEPLLAALKQATTAMEGAEIELEKLSRERAVPPEETALANLIEAAKLFEQSKCKACESSGLKITLKPPRSGSSKKKSDSKNDELTKAEAFKDLLEELKEAESEQKDLNQQLARTARAKTAQGGSKSEPKAESGSASASRSGSNSEPEEELARWQRELKERMDAAGGSLEELEIPEEAAGDRDSALKDLASTSAYQEKAAQAIDKALHGAAAAEGRGGVEKLNEAIEKIEGLMASFSSETDDTHTPPGYMRLVKEYLRSISYE
jgi:hypothetical protein